MKRVVVSDIFGRTKALEALAFDIDAHKVIDPYGGMDLGFIDEPQAYNHFTEHSSVNEYGAIVKEAIAHYQEPVTLIGFSVGASAVWEMIGTHQLANLSGALLFYGGQIRKRTQLQPSCPTTLVFAHEEQHFDVQELMSSLSSKERVNCHRATGLHGFMNAHSVNYNQHCYQHYLHTIKAKPLHQCVSSCSFSY
ncbi:dienelactone hydrolase family protein [Pseudoalteromonas pernae]|uniref:dienelactone hydrolase family protein n=1 Tax=Pseudoalteromonas pernae TaxID=3118054 RepID=UPI0032428339